MELNMDWSSFPLAIQTIDESMILISVRLFTLIGDLISFRALYSIYLYKSEKFLFI